MSTSHTNPAALHDAVRSYYGQAATTPGLACCGPTDEMTGAFGSSLYSGDQTASLPPGAVRASLGCGNPVVVANLRHGERVLDLGSGGGLDVLLAVEKVGPTGLVIGVDMTPEMLDLARRNAAQAGAVNAEFRAGTIENVPVPDAAVDVVISNCVINLAVDKLDVLREAYRVLVPGGRFGVADVVAQNHVTPEQRAERGGYCECIAGALSTAEYLDGLAAAGFVDASVELTHEVGDGLHGAIIRATKPSEGRPPTPRAAIEDTEPSQARCCAPDEQETCCGASDKVACCGLPAGGRGSCGCR